jgi:acyl-CoA synthetase (AMP-forming)/AMP-acid ligase II
VKRPDRPAVFYKDQKISYRELDEQTNRLANFLIKAGLKQQEVVGLYGHRSPAVVWAIMGILKARNICNVISGAGTGAYDRYMCTYTQRTWVVLQLPV